MDDWSFTEHWQAGVHHLRVDEQERLDSNSESDIERQLSGLDRSLETSDGKLMSRKLDNRWFREDHVPGDPDLTRQQKEHSDKALRSSTLLVRRLTQILEEEVEKTDLEEEAYEKPDWERIVLASASRRKTLHEIIKLLP